MTANRRKPLNTRMFALRSAPPGEVYLSGHTYRIEKVFKHDFFAATCLYQTPESGAEFPRIVVKFGREQDFLGLPTDWLGVYNRRREEAIYRELAGVKGTPAWIGRVGHTGYAIEYLDAVPLDHLDGPPAGFFDRLRELFDAIHARGVGYCDANKRSNILGGAGGEPYRVDFQLSVRRRPRWLWPWRHLVDRAVDYVIGQDLYHLYKHKRRLAPQELTPHQALAVFAAGVPQQAAPQRSAQEPDGRPGRSSSARESHLARPAGAVVGRYTCRFWCSSSRW